MRLTLIATVASLSLAFANVALAQAPSGAGALPGGPVGTGVNDGTTVPPSKPTGSPANSAQSATPGHAAAPDTTTGTIPGSGGKQVPPAALPVTPSGSSEPVQGPH